MISFNIKDYHMVKIRDASGLANRFTQLRYRIYGTLDSRLFMVNLTVTKKLFPLARSLQAFLSRHKISCTLTTSEAQEFNVKIGVRKSIRKDYRLTSCILQTIIYYFEQMIRLDDKVRISIKRGGAYV